MTSFLPSRILAFNSLMISGLSCLIYCLTIYYFVRPEWTEFLLLFVIPFLSFIAINFLAVWIVSRPLSIYEPAFSETYTLSEDKQRDVNKIHRQLVFGLHTILIPSAVSIHLVVMYIEDGGFQFLVDPDGWSLLINRIAMFMLIVIMQSSVFDFVLSKLKNQWNFDSVDRATMSKLFNRPALMLLSIILFLGSAIPLFSVMRFDGYIDTVMPSIAVNLDDSDELRSDLQSFSRLLEAERMQFVAANEKFQRMAEHLTAISATDSGVELDGGEIDELVSDMYDSIPILDAYEKGMDSQNTLSYMFITIALLRPFEDVVHTITADNGKEFAHHEQISKALSTEVYFAHPYSSWERGLNENTNGLLRQYFPKNTDFKKVEQIEVRRALRRLNSRPRKDLDFKTPAQLMDDHRATLAT